jgi:DNA-binding transcriptional MerR regulator
MKKLSILLILFLIVSVFMVGFVSADLVCETYDDFSSGVLDTSKWEIRQDVEGQALMEEYDVREEGGSYVFHTQQNTIADRRVYLFPKRQFTTGDVIEYDVNLVSRAGNHAQMVLLTGDQYIRIGMRGPAADFDELGVAHMKLSFFENILEIKRETPNGAILLDNLTLTNSNGNYELYIGSFSGHNGQVHIDYDNFTICTEEPGNTLYYKLDEGSGSIAHDEMENYDGVINNPEWVDGVTGKALRFDEESYVDVLNTSDLNFPSEFTLSAWIKFNDDNDDNVVVGKHISGYVSGYLLGVRNNKINFYVNNAPLPGNKPRLETSETYDDDKWHHIAGVYDGTQYLYVDGVLKAEQSQAYSIFSPANIRVGGIFQGENNGGFIGDIDEVRIYNKALTAEEIEELYESVQPDEEYYTKQEIDEILENYYTKEEVDELLGNCSCECEDECEELEERVEDVEEDVEEVEEKVSVLESLLDRVVEFIKGLPKGLGKGFQK